MQQRRCQGIRGIKIMQTWRGTALRRVAGAGPSEATNVAMPLAAKISNTHRDWEKAGEARGAWGARQVDLPSTAVAQFVGFYFWPFALAERIARLPYCQIAVQLYCHLPLASMQQIIGII